MKIVSLKRTFLFLLIPIFKILNIFNFKKNKPTAIVVFSTGKLGDMVCMTPIFKALKKANPNSTIIFVGQSPFINIFTHSPYLDKKIGFKNSQEMQNFSWIFKTWKYLNHKYSIKHYFSLINNFESLILGIYLKAKKRDFVSLPHDGISQTLLTLFFNKKHKFKYQEPFKYFWIKVLLRNDIPVEQVRNELYFNQPTPIEVKNFFKKNKLRIQDLKIGILVASGKSHKQWPTDHWIELIKKLINKYQAKIIFFGTQIEVEKIKKIKQQLVVETYEVLNTKIEILPYYLKQCNLFISVDAGPNYIADAMHVPVINIMGVCDGDQHPENNYRLLFNRENCPPLLRTPFPEPYIQKNLDKYFKKIKDCYYSITPDYVLKACQELLN